MSEPKKLPPPTRRLFMAMLGAAAAALAIREQVKPDRDPRLPRWIGHC